MVLNHTSLGGPDVHTAVKWLEDTTVGMSVLVRDGIAQSILRMNRPVDETRCLADCSLFDVYQALRKRGARDEYQFLMQLSNKVPLLSDIGQDIENRFLSCEATKLSQEDGAPLVLCAITDGIAVGFPTEPVWNHDQLTIRFNEMQTDGHIVEASEIIAIDNLTRLAHARSISERHRAFLRQCTNSAKLWSVRKAAFPNLVFGQEVERRFTKLGGADLRMLVDKLAMLDTLTAAWRDDGEAAPQRWDIAGVRGESETVRKSKKKLLRERRFMSHEGTRKEFLWHADFRGSERIHFRFDPSTYEVEIGYIGPHLPL